ncbi:MAG: hypothetical protein MPJ50_10200 [Pirellulales bacterium]|nr:hypothetical protein [Pirellulales bacterium]
MTVIKSQSDLAIPHTVEFNFEDVATKASAYLDRVREQGRGILESAQAQAGELKANVAQEARAEAEKSIQERVQELAGSYINQHLDSIKPAMDEFIRALHSSKQSWIAHWEHQIIDLATAIAARVMRTTIESKPDVPLELLREAIVLAAGAPRLVIHLNPHDFDALAERSHKMAESLAPAAVAEVVSDAEVSRGGCLVETEFGEIDQRFESQLKRIEEELT